MSKSTGLNKNPPVFMPKSVKYNGALKMEVHDLSLGTMKKLVIAISGSIFATLGTVGKAQAFQLINGQTGQFGNGTINTWLQLDDNNTPSSIGISLTQGSLDGLPMHEQAGCLQTVPAIDNHESYECELLFPQVNANIPFTHLSINWNPHGHGPLPIFNTPHFDVHFNLLSPEKRHNITGVGDDVPRVNKFPSPEFRPAGYFPPPGSAEARMGYHWADATSPDFGTTPFQKAMIWGSYNGEMAFWEPLITLSYLLTRPNFTEALKQPAAYAKSGYYPTAYSIKYDAPRQEYTVSLDGLAFRHGTTTSVPEPSSVLGTLVFGAFAAGWRLKKYCSFKGLPKNK